MNKSMWKPSVVIYKLMQDQGDRPDRARDTKGDSREGMSYGDLDDEMMLYQCQQTNCLPARRL